MPKISSLKAWFLYYSCPNKQNESDLELYQYIAAILDTLVYIFVNKNSSVIVIGLTIKLLP